MSFHVPLPHRATQPLLSLTPSNDAMLVFSCVAAVWNCRSSEVFFVCDSQSLGFWSDLLCHPSRIPHGPTGQQSPSHSLACTSGEGQSCLGTITPHSACCPQQSSWAGKGSQQGRISPCSSTASGAACEHGELGIRAAQSLKARSASLFWVTV